MIVIVTRYDPDGMMGGKRGCYRARVKDRPGTHDAGETPEDAFQQCITTAISLGMTNDRS